MPALDAITIRQRARKRALREASERFWRLAASEQAKAEAFARLQRSQAKTLDEQMAVQMDDAYLVYQHAAQLCAEWARETT